METVSKLLPTPAPADTDKDEDFRIDLIYF